MEDIGLRFAVALYGCTMPAPARRRWLFDWAVHHFTALKHPPDFAYLKGATISSRKIGAYKSVVKRLARAFDSLNGFGVYSATPNAGNPSIENYCSATFISDSDGLVVICVPVDDAPEPISNSWVSELCSLLTPLYGIGYIRHIDRCPDAFAYGLNILSGSHSTILTAEEQLEADSIGAWGFDGLDGRVYRRGILRDVYRWNFLTAAQLQSSVREQCLSEWIATGLNRGTLSRFTSTITLWEVPVSVIAGVRSELQAAKVIFDERWHGIDD